jgi:hypothetical protein
MSSRSAVRRPRALLPRGRRGTARTTLQRAALALLLVAPATAVPGAGGLEAQSPRASVAHGAEIRILTGQGSPLRGELLAVEENRLWYLARDEQVRSVGASEIRRVELDRHDLGSGRIGTWSTLAGGVTSAVMFAACTSVSSGGACAGFTLVWALAWAGVGGLSWAFAQPRRRVGGHALEELRPWARFPQGLPDGWTVPPGGIP